MAIEATFNNFLAAIDSLREAIGDLRLTAVEDRPLRDSLMILDRMGDAIDDLDGWLEQGSEATRRAAKAASYPIDTPRTIAALSDANTHLVNLQQKFYSGIASYQQVSELMKLGSSRGGEWRAWSNSVNQALVHAEQAIIDAHRALLGTWQELAERVSVSAVSVQTTNIGQQISSAGEPTGSRTGRRQETRDRMT
jgi:hypothetical protein